MSQFYEKLIRKILSVDLVNARYCVNLVREKKLWNFLRKVGTYERKWLFLNMRYTFILKQ